MVIVDDQTWGKKNKRRQTVIQSTLIANSIALKWKQVRREQTSIDSRRTYCAFEIVFFGFMNLCLRCGLCVECVCANKGTECRCVRAAQEEIAPGLSGLSILNNSFAGPRKYTATLPPDFSNTPDRRCWKDRRVPRGGSLSPCLCLHNPSTSTDAADRIYHAKWGRPFSSQTNVNLAPRYIYSDTISNPLRIFYL